MWRVTTKISVAFGTLLFLFLLFAMYGYVQQKRFVHLLQVVHEGYLPLALDLGETRAQQAILRSYLERLAQSATRSQYAGDWHRRVLSERVTSLKRTLTHAKRIKELDKKGSGIRALSRLVPHLQDTQKKASDLLKRYSTTEGVSATADLPSLLLEEQKLEKRLQRISNDYSSILLQQRIGLQDSNKRAVALLYILSVAVLLIGIYLAQRMQKLLAPLPMLQQRVRDLAQGQLRQEPLRMVPVAHDEISELSLDFERMVDALAKRDSGLKEAHQSRAQLESLQATILKSLQSGVLVLDHDNRIIVANPQANRLLALPESAQGRLLSDFPIAAQLKPLMQKSKVGAGTEVQSFTLEHVEGRTLQVKISAFTRELGSTQQTSSLFLVDDITQEIQTRATLLHSERLAAMGRMAAHITHEVRNPLSSIALNIELLEDQLTNQSSEAHEAIADIRREIQRLKQITEEYLRVVRLPSPHKEVDDLSVLVGSVLDFVKADMQAQGVTLELDLPPHLPQLAFDEPQMRQALLNLLRNAQEAMPEGGRIVVSLALEGAGMTIRVRDEGIGVPESAREQIFELFYTTKDRGSGLGLALSKQVVEAHRGTLRCLPSPGQGTIFEIWLPLAG